MCSLAPCEYTSQMVHLCGAALSKQHTADLLICHGYTVGLSPSTVRGYKPNSDNAYIYNSYIYILTKGWRHKSHAVAFLQPRKLLWLHMDRVSFTMKS